MRIIAVVQSRFGSARLPGKATRPISGRPMLAHVLGRAKSIAGVERVVLATTVADRDTQLTWIADDLGVDSYRGDEHDVLGRFCEIAERYKPDAVMRLTGDCPLLDPRVCEDVLASFLSEPYVPYVSNDTTSSGFPDGTDCEVVDVAVLFEARLRATAPTDREHVTPWIRRNVPQRVVRSAVDLSGLKLSVDSLDDLERVRRIFGCLDGGDASLAATVAAARRAMEM